MICAAWCLLILAQSANAETQPVNINTWSGSFQNQKINSSKISIGLGALRTPSLTLMEIAPLEVKAPPLNVIEGEVTDPNFNVMRNEATKKSTAVAWVIGCLVVATIVPLVTWWYFSR